MAFQNLIRPKKTVTLSDGQTFAVGGLSPNQVFGLYHRHRGQLTALFERSIAAGEVDLPSVASTGESLVAEAPLLLAEIITIAAGGDPYTEVPIDPEVPEGVTVWQADIAFMLDMPLPVQIDALQKIGEQSFTPDMPPKKFMGVLVKMLQDARESLPPSPNGSGD
ncbi:hypothetical protein U1872_06470 [Sphingomonas sp. RB3P16]|uniref:phage pre-tape measure protein n=1 Tax=Parasphingomonas frigoris TaxID=3096163 RepID=UPI002FC5AB80